jgi:hypothetical protein
MCVARTRRLRKARRPIENARMRVTREKDLTNDNAIEIDIVFVKANETRLRESVNICEIRRLFYIILKYILYFYQNIKRQSVLVTYLKILESAFLANRGPSDDSAGDNLGSCDYPGTSWRTWNRGRRGPISTRNLDTWRVKVSGDR